MNLGEDKQPGWAGLILRCSVHAWQADPEKKKPKKKPHPLLGLSGRWRHDAIHVCLPVCVFCALLRTI